MRILLKRPQPIERRFEPQEVENRGELVLAEFVSILPE